MSTEIDQLEADKVALETTRDNYKSAMLKSAARVKKERKRYGMYLRGFEAFSGKVKGIQEAVDRLSGGGALVSLSEADINSLPDDE